MKPLVSLFSCLPQGNVKEVLQIPGITRSTVAAHHTDSPIKVHSQDTVSCALSMWANFTFYGFEMAKMQTYLEISINAREVFNRYTMEQ